MKKWFTRRRNERACFHHDPGGNPANSKTAFSWIKQEIIDWRKLYWCDEAVGGCGKRWVK